MNSSTLHTLSLRPDVSSDNQEPRTRMAAQTNNLKNVDNFGFLQSKSLPDLVVVEYFGIVFYGEYCFFKELEHRREAVFERCEELIALPLV